MSSAKRAVLALAVVLVSLAACLILTLNAPIDDVPHRRPPTPRQPHSGRRRPAEGRPAPPHRGGPAEEPPALRPAAERPPPPRPLRADREETFAERRRKTLPTPPALPEQQEGPQMPVAPPHHPREHPHKSPDAPQAPVGRALDAKASHTKIASRGPGRAEREEEEKLEKPEKEKEDGEETKDAAPLRPHHAKPSFEQALAKILDLGEIPRDMAIVGLNVTHKSPHAKEWRVSTDLPRPPFEELSDLPIQAVQPTFASTYHTFKDVHLWCTGYITDSKHQILVNQSKTKRSEFLSAIIPEPSPDIMGVDNLGHYHYGLAFCDFWTSTYLVYIVDCIPRFVLTYYQLLEQHTDPEHPLYIVSPGEFWAMQFLVEVLGIPRHLILLTPNHIIWEIYYPTLYVSFGTLYWVPYKAENVPWGLQKLREKVFARHLLPKRPATAPGGGARVLFSERSDITMPANFTALLDTLQRLAPKALFQTVRFEALPVVQQLRLVAQADVLVGPAGGNLVNLLFMRPGAKVLELLSHNATAGPTDTEQLCRIAGLQYGRLMPARDWERKLQPIFEAPALLSAILSNVSVGSNRKPSKVVESVQLNPGPPFVGCQNLFHLPRRRKFIGWFKYGFLIPQWDFVFKFPRQAFWKRVLKEMVVLRNLTGDHIAPAKALCFYEMTLAQTIIGAALRRPNATHHDLDTFVSALAGFHRLWMAHRSWGRFFFYCDAGPKNWAMGFDQKLKMFDFDASYWVVDGVLCSRDRHCGCMLKDKGRPSACENNRCTYAGLERKVEALANSWLFSTFRGLWPDLLKDDNHTQEVWFKLRHKQLVRSDVVVYLKDIASRYKLDLCKVNLDVPECSDPAAKS